MRGLRGSLEDKLKKLKLVTDGLTKTIQPNNSLIYYSLGLHASQWACRKLNILKNFVTSTIHKYMDIL